MTQTLLLGEETYFSTELQRLIDRCNVRLLKAFNIRRELLRTEQRNKWEQNTLKRANWFIRTELDLRKEHQNKLKEAKYINN